MDQWYVFYSEYIYIYSNDNDINALKIQISRYLSEELILDNWHVQTYFSEVRMMN